MESHNLYALSTVADGLNIPERVAEAANYPKMFYGVGIAGRHILSVMS